MTLRGWAAGRQGTRLRCDFCGRTIVKPGSHVMPCTSCGHGHLREMESGSWGTWGLPVEPAVGVDPVERVRRLYTIIVNGELGDDEDSVMKRVCIIRELEAITHKDFRNTAEFHREVSAFLARKGRVNESVGARIRRAREKAGLTMKGLAKKLGVSTKTVRGWEMNANGYVPSPAAIGWLNTTLSDQEEKGGPRNE